MKKIVGIHLSSFNSNNTAIAVLRVDGPGAYSLTNFHDKVGALGPRFADDRIVDILACEGDIHEIFIDCPLSLPPCVSCAVPLCPGIARCEDLSVGMMQSMNLAVPKKKRRAVNPQSQRVWDIYQVARRNGVRHEPGFSSINASLAIRAMVLVKRLKEALPNIMILETQVSASLQHLKKIFGMQVSVDYRRFASGAGVRAEILNTLLSQPDLGFTVSVDKNAIPKIVESQYLFEAFIASYINACRQEDKVDRPPASMRAVNEWVYLPVL